MGYARDSKGYLIWFPDDKAIRVRRDVVFLDKQPAMSEGSTLSPLWEDVIGDLERRFAEKTVPEGAFPRTSAAKQPIDPAENAPDLNSARPTPRVRTLPSRFVKDNAEYSSEGGLRVSVNRGQITLSHNGRKLGDEITVEPTIASIAEICAPQANALQPIDNLYASETCQSGGVDQIQVNAVV